MRKERGRRRCPEISRPDKLKEWAKLGAKALAEKYGDRLSEWGRRGANIVNTKYKDKARERREKME